MIAERTKLAASVPILEPLLGVDDIAATLVVCRRKVERMRAAGVLPKPDLRVGKLLRWKAETIREWIESQAESN